MLFVFFMHFGILEKNLTILSMDTWGKKNFPLKRPKKIFRAFGANSVPQNLRLEKDGFENFGGLVGRGGAP